MGKSCGHSSLEHSAGRGCGEGRESTTPMSETVRAGSGALLGARQQALQRWRLQLLSRAVALGAGGPRRAGGGDRRRTVRGRSSGVERNLAKVEVEGSNPFARSIFFKGLRNFDSVAFSFFKSISSITGHFAARFGVPPGLFQHFLAEEYRERYGGHHSHIPLCCPRNKKPKLQKLVRKWLKGVLGLWSLSTGTVQFTTHRKIGQSFDHIRNRVRYILKGADIDTKHFWPHQIRTDIHQGQAGRCVTRSQQEGQACSWQRPPIGGKEAYQGDFGGGRDPGSLGGRTEGDVFH
jgi:hypothetical protein